jgi:hypothetical protein
MPRSLYEKVRAGVLEMGEYLSQRPDATGIMGASTAGLIKSGILFLDASFARIKVSKVPDLRHRWIFIKPATPGIDRCIAVLPDTPCALYCVALSCSFVRPLFNFTMSRQTQFQTKHVLEYGLKIVKRSPSGSVETVQCQFCVFFGRETREGRESNASARRTFSCSSSRSDLRITATTSSHSTPINGPSTRRYHLRQSYPFSIRGRFQGFVRFWTRRIAALSLPYFSLRLSILSLEICSSNGRATKRTKTQHR